MIAYYPPTEAIFKQIHTAGLTIELDGEIVRVRPTALVTAEIAIEIRQAKPLLVAALKRSAGLPDCDDCGRPLVAIPTFDGYENLECFTCDRCHGCRRANR